MQSSRGRLGRIARWIAIVPALLGPPALAFCEWTLTEGVAAAALYYALFAVVLDSWLVLCVVGGVLFGLSLDPLVKSGPAEAKIWETVRGLVAGTVSGVIFGLIFDTIRSHRRSNDAACVRSSDAAPSDVRCERA